jgi:hypothetical protein
MPFGWLPESDGCSGWVAENAHLAMAHDLADIDDDLGSEGFGLGIEAGQIRNHKGMYS